jgi:alkaline phosphatase D
VGSSITSPGPPYDRFVSWLPDNPHVRFFDSRQRGYVSVDLQPQRMEVAFRAISDPADPNAEVTILQHFVVADGQPGPVVV